MEGGRDYAFLTHRVDSFKGRRIVVPTAKNPRAVKTFLWPHPDNWGPTPRALAAAGFFFAPEPNSIDRVECFCCRRGLGSWEKADNPFKEHYERAENECAWAAARCSLERDRRGKGKSISWRFATDDRVPTDQSRYDARLQTFRDWPLDGIRGSTCTSKALARAGFVHTPEEENEDMTTCFYCNRELGGWKTNDDPLEDHRRGDQACPFLDAYGQTDSKRKKRGPTRTVLSKAASRNSLARHRAPSSTYASEVDLPVKRAAPKSSRYAQSEAEQETTTDADMATDTTSPFKSRKGRGRPKRAASSRVPSPADTAGASTIDSYSTRGKRPKGTSAASTRTIADSESEAPMSKPKRSKANLRAKVANSDDESTVLPTSRRTLRTPAVKSRRARSSDSSLDELLLPSSQRGTDLDPGSEGELIGRVPSRASSRAATKIASNTPSTSKGKRSKKVHAPSRAASSAVSDDDDGSGAESPKGSTRGRGRGSSRGRKTVTARDVAEQSTSLRRSSRTPGRSTLNGRAAATEPETDVDTLLKAAAARAAARHASVSDAEGKAARKQDVSALGRRTRARPASVLASDKDDEPDATTTARLLPSSKLHQNGATVSREAPANAPRNDDCVPAQSSLFASHRTESKTGGYLATSDSDTDDMNESTPQPLKMSNPVVSANRHRPIPPPNLSRETSLSAPAPSERPVVNEWRELTIQSKAQTSVGASTIVAGFKMANEETGTDGYEPRIIAPLRKSRGYMSRHHSPNVKIEEDDSIVMISPPRPPRNVVRPPPSIDQTLSDKSNQGLGTATKPRMVIQSDRASKLPTPKARTPQRTANLDDMRGGPVRAVRSPATPSRSVPRMVLMASTANTEQVPENVRDELPNHPPSTPAPAVLSNTHENIPSISAAGLQSNALDALHHISPFVTSSNGISEDQLNSTLEEFIRAETQRKYSEIQAEGERLLRELREEGARSRAVIIDHLQFSSQF